VIPSLDAFLDRLAPFLECWPSDVQLAVEIRNKGWISEEFASFLRRYRVDLFPKQGSIAPWVLLQNYLLDLLGLHFSKVNDGTMVFSKAVTPLAPSPAPSPGTLGANLVTAANRAGRP
jgi:Protein of unknown function DUF72